MKDYDWKYVGKIAASVCLSAIIGFFWISNYKKQGKIIPIKEDYTLGQVLKHEFKGKKAIVSFWASWCEGCKEDLSKLNSLKVNHPEKFEDYQLLTINLDKKEEREKLLIFWKDLNLENLKLLFDDEQKYQTEFSVDTLPTHFVFEKDGQVILRLEGNINWEDSKVLSLL